jgi:hypothetical protein
MAAITTHPLEFKMFMVPPNKSVNYCTLNYYKLTAAIGQYISVHLRKVLKNHLCGSAAFSLMDETI